MSADRDRWNRLVTTLADRAGVTAKIHERSYPGGVSFFVMLRTASGTVEIHDKWWRKNADVWIGWQVHEADREGIDLRTWPLTKKRGEVASAVKEAVAAAA